MRKFYKKLKRNFISFLIVSLSKIFSFFPLKYHKFLSLFLYFVLSKFRKIGENNLLIAGFKKKTLWKNFCFMTYGLLRFLKLQYAGKDEVLKNVKVKNYDIFENKINKGRGLLVYTLHFGFWEIIPAYFSLKGYPVCVLASRVYTTFIDNFINRIRKNFGTDVVHPDNTISLIKRLKKGYAIGILMDQKQGARRKNIKFFGREVEAPSGPLEIAYRLSPEVVLMKCETSPKNDTIYIEPFELSYNLEYDLQKIYNTFEKWIKEKPWQWIWIHQRF